MALDWDLLANAVITFGSTVVGVYLAFVVAERAERRRRMRDAFYAPFAELLDTCIGRLDMWRPLPLEELQGLTRGVSTQGLMPPDFRAPLRKVEAAFAEYAEHRAGLDTQVEHVLSDELGSLGPAKHALDSILAVTRGDARTVREALFDPRSYESAEPSREWLSAFVAIAIGTKKALSPGHKVGPGSPSPGVVITWNEQEYAMEPVFEGIAKRAFARVRNHAVREALGRARGVARDGATGLLQTIRAASKIPAPS